MYKACVFGDYDSIYGFSAVGLDIYPVTPETAEEEFQKVCRAEYAVIYMTEYYMALLKEETEACEQKLLPAVVPIPGIFGNTGDGIRRVKRMVEQAVGSDIIFGSEY